MLSLMKKERVAPERGRPFISGGRKENACAAEKKKKKRKSSIQTTGGEGKHRLGLKKGGQRTTSPVTRFSNA